MGILINHQVNAGKGTVERVPKSKRGYVVREVRVLVVPDHGRPRHGVKVQLGCAETWELAPTVLRPGLHTFRNLKRDNGEALHVPGDAILWIEGRDHRGRELTDPLLVATFDLETA